MVTNPPGVPNNTSEVSMNIRAGDFAVYVSQPYPIQISISYHENTIILDHGELRDLEYVIGRAIKEANRKLKSSDRI